MDGAVSWCLLILVDNEFSDVTFDSDAAACRVSEARNVALDARLHGAVLENVIAVFSKGAVHQGQVLAIAQGLFSCDVTADECEPATVPGKVLTGKNRCRDMR